MKKTGMQVKSREKISFGFYHTMLIRDDEHGEGETYTFGQSRVTVKGATHIVKGWNHS